MTILDWVLERDPLSLQPAMFRVVAANKFTLSVTDFKKFMDGICHMRPVPTSDWLGLPRMFFKPWSLERCEMNS